MPVKSLLEIGQRCDTALRALGLRLTQGGEPTFVARRHSSEEWNTAALGPEKLPAARRLAREFLRSLMPGAVAMLALGKQYDDEPAPRWTLSLLRGNRGQSWWKQPERMLVNPDRTVPPTPDSPERFLRHLARRLRLEKYVVPAYQNAEELLRMAGTGGRPDMNPRFSRSQRRFLSAPEPGPEDRQRLEDLCRPAGWVLPLDYAEHAWRSETWTFPATEEIVLLLGSGALGMRLPLGSLPPGALRRALTAEIREKELRVFVPPLPTAAAFADLIGRIEDAVAELRLPVITLEGYPPPVMDGMTFLGLSADPGVIEVNLPPSDDFPGLERLIGSVYDAADRAGLQPGKYHWDGRLSSTGGGSHILLGGPTPAENPFLLRPDLLASFIRFFQRHPCMSYLFTGFFIGSSSQAPRPDESIPEMLEELETALGAIEALPRPAEAAELDRLLRHLLLDWHGNTHRAEICSDKFQNPHAPNGRLGVVEFRAFEMMPQPDMMAACHVLIRSLAAVFAGDPFREPMRPWGSALHDRFLLPNYLWRDFHRVLGYLAARGFDLDLSHFQNHLAFRCPVLFEFETDAVRLECRQALEPWPVMGQRPGPSGGTTRPVDASTDRIQITLSGPIAHPHFAVAVNDLLLPLHRQPEGPSVAGVRYRLFSNPFGLHPHIAPHAPLRFDLIDLRVNRVAHSLAWHDIDRPLLQPLTRPINAEEAARRHQTRIVPLPERVGFKSAARPIPHWPADQITVDLRRLPPSGPA